MTIALFKEVGAEPSTRRRARVPVTVIASLAWLLTVDLMSRWGVQAYATIGMLCVLLLAVIVYVWAPAPGRSELFEPRILGQYRLPVVLGIWVVYALIRLAFNPEFATGLQNTSVQIIAVLSVAVTSAQSSASTAQVWMPRMLYAVVFSSIVYLATVPLYGFGNARIIDARAFASIALVGLCIAIALHATSRKKIYLAHMTAIFAALIASLSRTALLVGLVLLLVEAFKHRGAKAIALAIVRLALLAAVAWSLLENFAPLADRFATNDNAKILGVEVGTSGRAKLWQTMQESIPKSPIFGQGPGSSNALITESYGAIISHPHSEYLRIIHDYGWVGMILFGLGFILILIRSWVALGKSTGPISAAHLSSIMAVVSLAIMSATSNITVYIFAMLPLCTLMGFSMAHIRRRRASDTVRPIF